MYVVFIVDDDLCVPLGNTYTTLRYSIALVVFPRLLASLNIQLTKNMFLPVYYLSLLAYSVVTLIEGMALKRVIFLAM